MSVDMHAVMPEAVAGLPDEPVMDVADLAETADAGDDSPIDLSAIAEAEGSSPGHSPADASSADASSMSAEMSGNGDATAETGERQRPHWLSVTRVGASRP